MPKADNKGANVTVARDINNRRTFMKRRRSITVCDLGYVLLLLIMRINCHRSSDKMVTELSRGVS